MKCKDDKNVATCLENRSEISAWYEFNEEEH